MLYSGTPAALNPARNVAIAESQRRLVPGAGIPITQP